MIHKVLKVFRQNPERIFIPSEIGIMIGKSINNANQAVRLPIKKLMEVGFITQIKVGQRFAYKFNPDGYLEMLDLD